MTPSPAERGCPGGTEQAQCWSLPPSSWVPVLLGLAPPCRPWVTGDYLLPLRMRMVMWALCGRKNGDPWMWRCNTAQCPGCRTHRRLPGCFHSVVNLPHCLAPTGCHHPKLKPSTHEGATSHIHSPRPELPRSAFCLCKFLPNKRGSVWLLNKQAQAGGVPGRRSVQGGVGVVLEADRELSTLPSLLGGLLPTDPMDPPFSRSAGGPTGGWLQADLCTCV